VYWRRPPNDPAFCFGLFAFPLYTLSVAQTNDHVDPADYVEVAGGLLLVFALGAVVGPIIASAFVRFGGIGSLFLYTAVIHAATAGFTVHQLRRRAVEPEGEPIPFTEAIQVAQTVSSIDVLPHYEEAPAGDSPQ